MKRFIYIILVLIFILASCSSNKSPEVSGKENNSKYFIFILDNMLVKINCKTAISTTLCQDPLCDHSELNRIKCPFYCSSGNYSVSDSGNAIFFIHQLTDENPDNPKEKSNIRICKYGLITGELKSCYEVKNQVTSNLAYKEDYYFTEMYSDNNKNGDKVKFTNFYKVSSDGSTAKLNKDKIEGYYFLDKVKENRLYFFDTTNQTKYNSTYDVTDIKKTDILEYKNNDNSFECSRDNKTNCITIKSSKDSYGNRAIITDKCFLNFTISDYIYYTKYLDENKIIFEDEKTKQKQYTEIDNKLYRSKFDGSENGVFCDFGEHYNPFYINNYNFKNLIDDYCLIRFTGYIKDEKGQVLSNQEYAVLNLKTGEYKMVT